MYVYDDDNDDDDEKEFFTVVFLFFMFGVGLERGVKCVRCV